MNSSLPAEGRQGSLTDANCYYRQEHLRRDHPHCEGVPIVAYGSIVLCAECDKRRSAIGRTDAPRPVPGAQLTRLDQAAGTARKADRALADAALSARAAGASWTQIGRAVGVTRQAAQQRWGAPHHDQPSTY